MLFTLIFLMLGTFVFSYSLIFTSLRISRAIGAIDHPNRRKEHRVPTARAGGLSFFLAFSLFLAISNVNVGLKISLLSASSVTFLIGLLDDAHTISPFKKLMGQLGGASIYVLLEKHDNPLIGCIIILWIVFLSNATNLTDGLNGLAAGISAVESICLAVVSLFLNNIDILICSLLLFFAIVGFLPSNFPRAKIFMGDCGALFLGATLGVLSSRLVIDGGGIVGAISVLLIFIIPIAETIQSFFRRIINGKDPFSADRGHFHHKLIDAHFTKECATLVLVTASLIFGLIGTAVFFLL